MKKLNKVLAIAALATTFAACEKEETPNPPTNSNNLNLNISGLEDLGADFVYEGWIMVNGSPKTAGIFTVDANGNLSASGFELDQADVDAATAYILTIEPNPDPDPNPSAVHILAGDFNGNSASITTNHPGAIGTDFTAATGKYILATPTDMDTTNEASGVWWLDPMAGPGPGLDLPTLPAGWKYEGWGVVNGTPFSTGTFTSVTGADDAAPFSGPNMGPPFPGEDFLQNAPSGSSFPVDLRGGAVVISVEPDPDNSPMPFTLKPLVGMVDAGANVHSVQMMANNATNTNPTGTVTR